MKYPFSLSMSAILVGIEYDLAKGMNHLTSWYLEEREKKRDPRKNLDEKWLIHNMSPQIEVSKYFPYVY